MKNTTVKICRAGIIAGLYTALSLLFQPISFGAVQFRIAEILTVLPLFYFESVPALFIGCLLSNVFGLGVYDMIIASLSTLVASLLTYLIGKKIKNVRLKFFVGVLPQIVLNAFLVPVVLYLSGLNANGYFIQVLIVAGGEIAVLYTLGVAFYFAFIKFYNNK